MNTIEETEIKNVDSQPTTSEALKDGLITEKLADGSHSVTQIRRTAGPRTRQGKERSKHNALKHGIFSNEVLLDTEAKWKFNSLLRGLRADFKPGGTLEGILVEKLASLIWRYRRMLIAEQAEIRRGTEYFWWDESMRRDQEAALFLKREAGEKSGAGLIMGLRNPHIRLRCVEQLQLLKRFIEEHGFRPEHDFNILRMVFGDSAMATITYCSVATYYASCMLDSKLTEQERLRTGSPSLEECKKNFVEELGKQIKQLESNGEVIAKVIDQKEELEARCRNVPDTPKSDRLLRYEASLDRSFDRTLSQLERQQRMRLGQPVLPKLEVRHSLF